MAYPEDRALSSQIKRRLELNGERQVALSPGVMSSQTRVPIRAIFGGPFIRKTILFLRPEPG